MSKVDAMRALREARRAAASAAPAAAPRAAARAAAQPPPSPAPAVAAPLPASEAVGGEALCGHRNMGGRSCTRELDHVKNGTKNHRYG
jgi:hypothetical protein